MRRLDGTNEIIETDDSCRNSPGVRDLKEFLIELKLASYEGFLELAQVLKIPFNRILNCELIERQAQDNIREYVEKDRLSKQSLEFLSHQSGEAGTKNAPGLEDNSDFKDNCG